MINSEAAVVRSRGGPILFEEVTIDEPRPDELIVRVIACGICHTDIAVRDGKWAPCFPRVLGHEGAGIVGKVGKKVTKVKPGDKVLLSFGSCGHCTSCRKEKPARCQHFDAINFGSSRLDGSPTLWDACGKPLCGNFFGQSSFAYHALTHERNVIPIRISEEKLPLFAPLGCGIQAGAGTVIHELQPQVEDSLLVFGVGTVGLAAIMAAHMLEVKKIIAVDTVPSRLKLAKSLGATHTIDSMKIDPFNALKRSVDHIVDTTGKLQILQLALELLSDRGKLSLLAISEEEVDVASKLRPRQKLIESIAGDSNPQQFLPFLIRCYKKGLFPFDRLIRFYPAKNINHAIEDSLKGKTIKPVLLFTPSFI